MLGQDFDGTLRELSRIGYHTIEMCSPRGYEGAGFGSLAGTSAQELRKRIRAAELTCESCHFTMRELREFLDERIAFAQELGLKQMVLASFGVPKSAALADWTRAAEELNRCAAKIQAAGMRTAFHNHATEFQKIDGVLIYDRLMEALDPKLVQMQFQVSVVSLGYHAADYFTKYPGRFLSIHLQDWSPADKKTVAIGTGIVEWKRLFSAAKTGGVKNYFVELNLDAMRASYPFLRDLKV
jgi:sugar phosphate isomerase/epimerase